MGTIDHAAAERLGRDTIWSTGQTRFGLYIHWPFCLAKCPYCDFNSHVRHNGVDETSFTGALVREMQSFAARTGAGILDSIFFGGGTPSLMTPAAVSTLIEAAADLWPLSADAEITLEANPTSVEARNFAGYRTAGVNRVSVGVQALDDRALKALGRQHSVAEAMAALDVAHTNFERVSFDLIYARPHQSAEDWRAELTQALARAGDHLSLYQLTIEPGTPFAVLHDAGKLIVPEEDLAVAFYEVTQELCEAAGIPAYEISNHARPGAESRHNLIYWRYGDYIGIGPGAHSRITVAGERLAIDAHRDPEAWRREVDGAGTGSATESPLSAREQTHEILVMGLRLSEGLPLSRLRERGLPTPAPDTVIALARMGLLNEEVSTTVLQLTPRGRLVLNAVAAELAASL